MELAEADLLNEESMFKAIEGAKYVVHTASPFPIAQPKNENDLIKPAVEGTMAAMKACHQNKVERIVITSSVAAIYKTTDWLKKDTLTTDDWTDVKLATPYEKSKTLAEKAAWDFLANLPENERFEMATINPGFVIGPNLNEAKFSSGDIIKDILIGKNPGIPRI